MAEVVKMQVNTINKGVKTAKMAEMTIGIIKAFVVGGALCGLAQVIIDKTGLTPARVLVAYVCSGVLLTAVGVYRPLVEFAGAGATVPLTGFGYSLAKGTAKAIDEHGAFGIISGGLSGTAAGITAAIVLGFIAALIFPSQPKFRNLVSRNSTRKSQNKQN